MTRERTLAARPAASPLFTALVALLAALGLTAVLATATAPAAQAHDRLTGSEPGDGAQLDTPPAAIALTFNTEPLAVEPRVVVTDAAGEVVAEGAPTIDGSVATLPLDAATLGGDSYTVAWRVVSSDGHPIEGSFGFAVAEQPEPTPSEPTSATDEAPATEDAATEDTATEDADESAAAEPDTTAATTDEADATDAEDGSSALPIVVGAIAVLAVVGTAVVLVLRRRGYGPADGADDGTGPQA
ncbi:copper resistance CopC family protein [Cellulosimicrobium marinum]|uniref:copper resistance CopC family protein n=1 Tax=Cellulosimicrobium marinum TaxID=1638992 RepID=UPI001E4E798D|nr:copper resistance CopC family protein [Cellulosimicrobium marinum]MCB7135602.1 copper resistance protein CopC [Cellulosimicrobium marinum]